MTRRTDVHPVLDRPGVGAPFFSTWRVGTPQRQRQVVEAVVDTWLGRPWPAEGLLGYFLYTGEDGSTLLHYSQWADEQAYEAFVRTRRQERNDAIDTAVPDIERVRLGRYRHYRSLTGGDHDTRVPGCVVIVDIEFDGPDPVRQRAWVDAVAEALATEPNPHPGDIAAHFHLGSDGTRVLNYAEWESAQDHIDALADGQGVGSLTGAWHRVQTWPGLKGSTISRYEYALGLLPD
ncbi:antibiotic biosynthesis monooxygenase [Streptomyces sp. NPDC008159]|uniref:antibiotic biosynthesis monooxygenase n=1 Tax=Streptomyces sp. NPDC008159 TaxID=3364817 RepID=UPI0036ECBEE2